MPSDARSQAQYERMTQTPVSRLIPSLAIPTMISMLISGFYNLADTYFVSSMKLDSATAAVGVVFSLMSIIQAVGYTLGVGSGSLASRLLGQQRKEDADRTVSSGFAAALLFGLLVSVFGLGFLDPLMRLLGSNETVLPYARDYARYILLGAPIMAASFVLNNCLRSSGHATFAMAGITTGGILNIALDPLFIFGFELGIAGAAIATLISQCVSFSILLFFTLSRYSVLHLSLRIASRDLRQYGLILSTGMASFCRQGLASVASVALNHAALAHGDAALAAMSVVNRVFMLIMSALIGFVQGYQPVAGYNYGAKRFDRVREAIHFTLRTGTLMMVCLGVICFLSAPYVVGLFSSGGEMLTIGTTAMRFQCVSILIHTVTLTSNMTMQAVGRSKLATFLASCRQGIYFLPLILLLPRLWGLNGVLLTQPLSDVLTVLTCIPFLRAFLRELKALETK